MQFRWQLLRREFHCAKFLRNQQIIPKSLFDVNCILSANEFTKEFSEENRGHACIAYDSNQLPSNSPCEDSRTEGSLIHTSGLLVGVFDGHAGNSCSQVISKRLLRYIGASLVPPQVLRQCLQDEAKSHSFVKCHNDKHDFIEELRDLYEQSFQKFTQELLNRRSENFQMEEVLENAFLRLDEDITNEAMDSGISQTLSVALSGSVAIVAHIDKNHLHVASTGDCQAVLGSINENGDWSAKKMSEEHNAENMAEVRRILAEHPNSERDTVIRGDRLLSQLAPLRAFGDVRYKWSRDQLQKLVVPHFGEQVIPPNYHTPPYLSVKPSIQHHILTPKDKFLVMASDGLWDVLSPLEVVQLVGEHGIGKASLQPFKLPKKKNITLGELDSMLQARKANQLSKPIDKNASTHLIRNALGGTDYGIDNARLFHLLSLPPDIVRLFRDDITITILYFDTEYLRNIPA
ncbi:CLUMA_CG004303, isoform A [Clunio marinus]|uniref:CLUMA_CG004303, isoform A n=1 Tax=Clunio marinus TaxID=568069 RepID=A0A1J1HWU8_9DIPT|nr:CLUMA_CG004303, isoform A [Clunio marinus]